MPDKNTGMLADGVTFALANKNLFILICDFPFFAVFTRIFH
jgi:hypothetical protein